MFALIYDTHELDKPFKRKGQMGTAKYLLRLPQPARAIIHVPQRSARHSSKCRTAYISKIRSELQISGSEKGRRRKLAEFDG